MQSDTAPRIYVEESGTLSSYSDTEFASEDAIQELLANHPELLAGELFESGEPLRWLLIAREMGVPDSEGSVDRWALDHLFVDQNRVPTFVEVKRASNRELRRHVIGQILDYAANGARWWKRETLVEAARRTAERQGVSYEELMRTFLGADFDEGAEDQFWTEVMENLENGKVRLVIAADRLPAELVTVIEFLNKAMRDVQVIGLQLQQFKYENRRLFVPRVRGLPEEKATTGRRRSGVNPEVRDFLTKVRDRLNEVLGPSVCERFGITSAPQKELWYWLRSGTAWSAGLHIHDAENGVTPGPLWLRWRVHGLKDRDLRERVKRKLETIVQSELQGAYVDARRTQVEAWMEFDVAKSGLSDELASQVADGAATFIRVIAPQFYEPWNA